MLSVQPILPKKKTMCNSKDKTFKEKTKFLSIYSLDVRQEFFDAIRDHLGLGGVGLVGAWVFGFDGKLLGCLQHLACSINQLQTG